MAYSNIEELRAERNARLAACDFYFLQDIADAMPEGELSAMQLYRQALRDLPASYDGGSETEVEWPVQPFTSTQGA
jgi:hypothetical protein